METRKVEEWREEFEKEFGGQKLVYANELTLEDFIQKTLDQHSARLVERHKKLHYELVQEFRDNLITIAIENEHLRGCVTGNQIHDAFENFCASEHQAIDIIKDNK
jgi:sugar phosphate isomerase/epimerase